MLEKDYKRAEQVLPGSGVGEGCPNNVYTCE
jgi:hypothetical protein